MTDWVAVYIDAVDNGTIVVGKKIQQAIDRHLRDVEKSKDESYPYIFDPAMAEMPINFIGSLLDPKSGNPNELALFQKFMLSLIFGWVHKETGFRRFRKLYISLARKQGKSLIIAGIALYILIYGKSPKQARQVYSTANKKDQAKIVFKMVKSQLKTLRSNSKFIKKFTRLLQTEIITADESFMSPLSNDSDTLDGLDVSLGIFDEYSLSKTTEMMEVIETSMTEQDEPLIAIISTVSSKLNYPMHTIEYPYVEKLLNQEFEDDNYLALCWEQDSINEVQDESLWMKSNPLLELGGRVAERIVDRIKTLYEEGIRKGTVSSVLTKHFNLWVQATKESYFTKEEWLLTKSEKNIDIKGRKIYIGMDVSRSGDLTSISWVVPIEEMKKYYVDSFSFVATKGGIEQKEKDDATPYRLYEEQGYCQISTLESGLIDYDAITDWLIDFVKQNELKVTSVCYDPAYANVIVQRLEGVFDLIEVPQRAMILSAPTKNFKYQAENGQVISAKNPLLDRAIYNSITVEKNDLMVIDKTSNRNKIDPTDALLNAWSESQYHDWEGKSLAEMIDDGEFGFGW